MSYIEQSQNCRLCPVLLVYPVTLQTIIYDSDILASKRSDPMCTSTRCTYPGSAQSVVLIIELNGKLLNHNQIQVISRIERYDCETTRSAACTATLDRQSSKCLSIIFRLSLCPVKAVLEQAMVKAQDGQVISLSCAMGRDSVGIHSHAARAPSVAKAHML